MAKKWLVDLDLNQNELQNSVIQNLATDPGSGKAGQIYYNTADNKYRYYNGSSWQPISAGAGTVTSVGVSNATNGGLTISGSPVTTSGTISIGHSNVLANAQTTSGIYPIKIDKNGHITEYGTALGNVSTTAAGLLPAFSSANQSSTAVSSNNYVWDASQNKYAKLPSTAFSDTTYTDGTAGYVLKAKQDKDGNQIDTTYAKLASPALTGTPTAPTANTSTNNTQIATTAFVHSVVDNLPEPMVFKGSLGTGGTITALPVDGTASIGDTYKVITDGTYAGQAAKVGDTFICDSKTSSANTWTLIPSGDEPSGTVTSVAVQNDTNGGLTVSGSPITSSGTIKLKHTNQITAQATQAVYPIKIDVNGHISAYGSAVTILKKYAGTITGNASTKNFTVNHALGSRDIIVQVYDGSTYEEVMVDITRTDTNNVTIGFAVAPASSKTYKVVCIG